MFSEIAIDFMQQNSQLMGRQGEFLTSNRIGYLSFCQLRQFNFMINLNDNLRPGLT